MPTFVVRPSGSEKTPFRICLTTVSLLALKMRPGDLCNLYLAEDDSQELTRQAVAWENSGQGMKDNIVQMSKTLQMHHGFKLGDKISIKRSPERLQDAKTVLLQPTSPISIDEQLKWSLFASASIPPKHDILAIGQQLTVEVGDHKREFRAISVGDGLLGRVTKETAFTFSTKSPDSTKLILDFTGVGGLQSQISHIHDLVDRLFGRDWSQEWDYDYRPHGLLLHGGPGSGKSLLQKKLSACNWANVVQWESGSTVATDRTPQLINIEFDTIFDKRNITLELLRLFQSIEHSDTLVVGTARDATQISERLRNSETFALTLELPPPSASQRLDILNVVRSKAKRWDDECLQELASRTHGYAAGDLIEIMRTTFGMACKRQIAEESKTSSTAEVEPGVMTNTTQIFNVTPEDIQEALTITRPSALKEISFEKPKVRWSDIGGLHAIKQQLQEAIDMPLKHPKRMKALGLEPKKGILLYGPPGCSKTLIVRALSAETDLNFISIKAAELVSMYVGESEKATREVFRKARLASPCIIFFDEIDAIASRARTGSDLNILTTLLTEMDGFNAMKNVFVVAATNKPQSLDSALLRPGRFDNVVYMGPPDIQGRQEIFDKRFASIRAEEGLRQQTLEFAHGTEGRSGAEIVAICQAAGENAFRDDRDFIRIQDVLNAIATTPKGISPQMLEDYANFENYRRI